MALNALSGLVTSKALRGLAALLAVAACSRSERLGARARPDASARSGGGVVISERAAPPASSAASAPAAQASVVAEPTSAALPPLAGSEPFVTLDVEGAAPAVVSVPLGATRARPVAVALHGNFDRPEWQCEVWRGVLGERGFVLCPRGVPRRDVPKSADRWEYASLNAVEREIDAGLAALRARFGAHVDPGPLLFIGFSLGAIHGAPLVQKRPDVFPRVVLVEGGQERWTRSTAEKFAKGGGLRLFLACGQIACLTAGKRLGLVLESAGLPTKSGGHPKAGHTYDGEVAAAVARELAWLFEGDPRWEPL